MRELEIVGRDAQQIYATWGPVVVRIVDGAATEPADIDLQYEIMRAALERSPSIGMLLVAHHGNPVPSVATMRYATKRMAAFESRLVVGLALLGLGDWGAVSRAAARFLNHLVRSKPFVLGSSVEETTRAMALELIGLDADGLRDACSELERRFRTPP